MIETTRLNSTRVHYMLAVIRALYAHGGQARPAEVYAWLGIHGLRRHQVPPPNVDADVHYQREVRFARQELAEGGMLFSDNGVWKLNNVENDTQITAEEARRIVRENRRRRNDRTSGRYSISTGRPTIGPRPSSWEGTIVRQDGPASTYVFKFGETDLRKVGFTTDVDDRLKQVNQHIPVEILGSCWKLEKTINWPSQDLAYAMEQDVLRRLTEHRTVSERVRCGKEKLERAWKDAQNTVSEMAIASISLSFNSKVTPESR